MLSKDPDISPQFPGFFPGLHYGQFLSVRLSKISNIFFLFDGSVMEVISSSASTYAAFDVRT